MNIKNVPREKKTQTNLVQLPNLSRRTMSSNTGLKKAQRKQFEKLTANYYPKSPWSVYEPVGPWEVTGKQSILQRNHRQLNTQGRWAESLQSTN